MITKMTTPPIWLYDTTLRDGTQGEGINFSCEDKLRIARKLDDLGVHYIEGGWPGSNPKDIEFFQRAQGELKLRQARVCCLWQHLPRRGRSGRRCPDPTAGGRRARR